MFGVFHSELLVIVFKARISNAVYKEETEIRIIFTG